VFFVDEAGVRSDYFSGTTGAPVGQTPTVTVTGVRFRLNLLSAVSAQGALRSSVLAGTLTGAEVIAFVQRLWHDAERTGSGPPFCIVDNHPVHRAKGGGQIRQLHQRRAAAEGKAVCVALRSS
jgi:hypothetical protein